MSAPVEKSSRRLPSAVVWLGVVSLLTDASGEMIYPLLPLFLTSVLGAAPGFVGIVEGVAETTASLLKLVSGWITDHLPRKKPLTVLGYGISSTVRPLVALATAPWMVLAIRFTDRVGKGLRSTPRDAIVAEVTPADRRGAAYGYHRGMDNAGAVIGPLVGFALLGVGHFSLRAVFGLSAIPAGLAVAALVFGVREPAAHAAPHKSIAAKQKDPAASQYAWFDGRMRRYFLAVALFTLSNSSDAFLLLRAKTAGVTEAHILLLWTLHNGVKALLSRRFGALSDRLGRRTLILGGWTLYGLTYLGFGLANRTWQIWALFAIYGLYYALVEGTEKALVADLAPPEHRGRAFGIFNGVVGLLALPASLLFSALYHPDHPIVAFAVAAGLAGAASLLLLTVPLKRTN